MSQCEVKISVLMSVHNGERFLREAVESVLSQTFKEFEFIVVDDASTDASSSILDEYARSDSRVKVLRNEKNLGLTCSLNIGLTQARGTYVARQDADDVSLLTRLEKQVAYLDSHPEVGLVGSAYRRIDADGAELSTVSLPSNDTDIRWRMLFENPFGHPTVMFRREALVRLGRAYDESLSCAQDYELWTRMLQHARGANLEEPLIVYRVHPDSITVAQAQRQREIGLQISACQIGRLLSKPGFTSSDAGALRRWMRTRPISLCADTLGLAILLLEILTEFSKLPELDDARVSALQQDWSQRILDGLPLSLAGRPGFARLLFRMFRCDPRYACGAAAREFVGRFRRRASGLCKPRSGTSAGDRTGNSGALHR